MFLVMRVAKVNEIRKRGKQGKKNRESDTEKGQVG